MLCVLNTLPYYAKKQKPNMGSHFICRCTYLLIYIFKLTEIFSFIDTLGGVGTKVGGVARVEEVILGAFQTHIQNA